jgi:predicted membrane channel-forming protein YqfA (hemolysin III family)
MMQIVSAKAKALKPVMTDPKSSSFRKLAGIALILLLIVFWAAFVASLARLVGRWPILLQAPFYLVMGIVWIIPLKPLIRWMETGRFGSNGDPRN